MQADTHAAIRKQLQEEGGLGSLAAPGEIVIHFRCTSDTYFGHRRYGLTAFSIYRRLSPYCGQIGNVRIVSNMDTHHCKAAAECLTAFLRGLCPQWDIAVVASTIFDDFRRMVDAAVFVPARSTFSLAAALANRNRVISPTMLLQAYSNSPQPTDNTLDSLENWQWDSALVLTPTVGEEHGLDKENVQSVCSWLSSH